MPLYADSGVLLADGTSLQGCCCDEFECGVSAVEIAVSGVVDDGCSTCELYNTTHTAITTINSRSVCGIITTCHATVVAGPFFDFCYAFLPGDTPYYIFELGISGSTRHAFLYFNRGFENPESYFVWHKTQGTDFTFPITFTSADRDVGCDMIGDISANCDFSSAVITVSEA